MSAVRISFDVKVSWNQFLASTVIGEDEKLPVAQAGAESPSPLIATAQ